MAEWPGCPSTFYFREQCALTFFKGICGHAFSSPSDPSCNLQFPASLVLKRVLLARFWFFQLAWGDKGVCASSLPLLSAFFVRPMSSSCVPLLAFAPFGEAHVSSCVPPLVWCFSARPMYLPCVPPFRIIAIVGRNALTTSDFDQLLQAAKFAVQHLGRGVSELFGKSASSWDCWCQICVQKGP